MICTALIGIAGLTERALLVGDRELDVPFCLANSFGEFWSIHKGKELAIEDLAAGGNGHLYCMPSADPNPTLVEYGSSTERSDLQKLKQWQANLANCKYDRSQGRVS